MNRKFTRLSAHCSHYEGNSTQDRLLLRSSLVITTGIGLQSRITLVYMWELLRNAALGGLLAFCLAPGNVDDRKPVPKLVSRLFSKLFGDKGYLSQPLAQQALVTQGLHLITKLRQRMRNRLLDWPDKLLLHEQVIIETITDQPKKPSLDLRPLALPGT
jgi:hypothetical protein